MKKVIKSGLVFLIFFFSFSPLASEEIEEIKFNKNYRTHFLHFVSPEDKFSQAYKVLSIYETKDYLIFDVEKMDLTPSSSYQQKPNNCIFKNLSSQNDLQKTEKHSKIIFSKKDINNYNSIEPGEPVVPLPAPLPYREIEDLSPYTNNPIEPVVPLPAPLPYYINSYTKEYVISNQDELSRISSPENNEWSNDIDSILNNYFYKLKKTCDTP